MFIGREQETERFKNAIQKVNSATLLYGKRRVGKTTLIKHVLSQQDTPFVYYECLKSSMQDNIDGLTQELQRSGLLPAAPQFARFQDLFAFLNALSHPVVVVIDEYPYLKAMTPAETVDSTFQSVIDNRLRNVHLVLAGSHIGVMKEMLEENNALYGRFETVICLRELSYLVSSEFYPELKPYDRIGFYSVFGGSPFVLRQLDPGESLKVNIIRTVLSEHHPIHLYASNNLLSDYSNSMNAERIFAVLGNGRKRYTEIEAKLNANKTGNLSKQLKQLVSLEIVRRNAPINKPHDKKKVGFEINDNLMRFYFTYVYRNRSALLILGPEEFYNQYSAPTIGGFIAHRFEEICRDYFSIMAKLGRLKGIHNIGSYYYDDPAKKTNGEFDVALDYGDHYAIYEAKYYSVPLTLDEIHHELGQIRAIRELTVTEIGFIAASGFAAQEAGYMFLTADDLYRI